MGTSNQKFYVCKHCGNLVGMVFGGGAPVVCCGEKMAELTPNTVDASQEKHVPAVVKGADGGITVNVGSAAHPMEAGHHISFIYVESKNGGQRKNLKAGGEPSAVFSFAGDEPVAVYAYCNLHGLWKCDL